MTTLHLLQLFPEYQRHAVPAIKEGCPLSAAFSPLQSVRVVQEIKPSGRKSAPVAGLHVWSQQGVDMFVLQSFFKVCKLN